MTLTAKQGDCDLSRSEIVIGEDVMVILRNNIFILVCSYPSAINAHPFY